MRLGALVLLIILLSASAAYAVSPSVTNVQARQEPSGNVIIEYTLSDPDTSRVLVSALISNNGGSTYSITPVTMTGNFGWVTVGGTKRIVWDAKKDQPGIDWANCKAKVTADDSSGGAFPGAMIYIPAGSFLMGNNGHEPFILG